MEIETLKSYPWVHEGKEECKQDFLHKDANGTEHGQPETVPKAFIEYYTNLLGTSNKERSHVCSTLIRKGAIIT